MAANASHSSTLLTQEEQEKCRAAFLRFDKDRSGSIDQHELRAALEAFGQKVSDEELLCVQCRWSAALAPGLSGLLLPTFPPACYLLNHCPAPAPPSPPPNHQRDDCRRGHGRQRHCGLWGALC